MAKYYYHKHEKNITVRGTDVKVLGRDNPNSTMLSNTFTRLDADNFSTIFSDDIKITGNHKTLANGYLYIYDYAELDWSNGEKYNVFIKENGVLYLIVPKTGGVLIAKTELGHIKGDFIETIKAEEGTYPDNGVHTDGYWYVKGDKATIPIYPKIDGKWKESDTGYVNVNGVWKEIQEVYQKQNGEWNKLF